MKLEITLGQVCYLELFLLLKNQLVGLGKVSAEGRVDREGLVMLRKDQTKVLVLDGIRGVGLNSDEKATLKVDQGVEVTKDKMDHLERDDGTIRLESAHVGLQVL